MNNCSKCYDKLNGVMIFHRDICLNCVIELESVQKIDYLKHKKERKQ